MHLQPKRGWSPRSCVPAAMCSRYAGHYRNHLTAGSLAALKRDFNITEIEVVSTRIITEALASAVEQSAYVWYARVPGQYWYTRSTVPPIHDITTDIT